MIKRRFIPIGHGAFYVESFLRDDQKTIYVVYDCGSMKSVAYLEEWIQKIFKREEEIEAVVISHFDRDHVKGLPYLLHYCKVKKLYLPMVTESERNILEIAFAVRRVGGFTRSLLRAPDKAIERLKLKEDHRPQIIEILENDSLDDNTNKKDKRQSGNNLAQEILGEERSKWSSGKDRVTWNYIPFNFKREEQIQELLKKLKVVLGYVGDINDLEKELGYIWKSADEITREKIKLVYKSMPEKINTNSMTLFSGEKREGKLVQMVYGEDEMDAYYASVNSGCLYTGDYDASGNEKWDRLKNAYKNYWDEAGVIQLPHHGSQNNFNAKFIKTGCHYIVSVGADGKGKHPSKIVKDCFRRSTEALHIITARENTEVWTEIDN